MRVATGGALDCPWTGALAGPLLLPLLILLLLAADAAEANSDRREEDVLLGSDSSTHYMHKGRHRAQHGAACENTRHNRSNLARAHAICLTVACAPDRLLAVARSVQGDSVML